MMNVSDLKKRVYAGDNMINLTDIRYLPRWVILMLDILILVIYSRGGRKYDSLLHQGK